MIINDIFDDLNEIKARKNSGKATNDHSLGNIFKNFEIILIKTQWF